MKACCSIRAAALENSLNSQRKAGIHFELDLTLAL